MEQVALNRHEEYFKDNVGEVISQVVERCQLSAVSYLKIFSA